MTKSASPSAGVQKDCQDAVRQFFKDLSADESKLFEATNKAEQLINDLQDLDGKHKNSISRKVASNIKTFVAGIEQYGSAMDVLAGSISLMSPIWASARIVLQVAKEYSEYFDKLSDMFEEIGYNLTTLRRYPRLYPDNQILQEAMVDIFQSIMEFCSKAREVFQKGKKDQSGARVFNPVGLRAAWKLIWKPFKVQFGGIIEGIQSSMGRIEGEVNIAEKEMASEERTKAERERNLQTARWDKLEAQQKSVANFIDQQKIAQVNQWLTPVNAAANHNSATKLRHKGTGTWFLDGESFQKWMAEDNSFLWLHAIPGAGKTVLASTVINWLRDNKESKDVALAYFYCDYKDKQKQSPTRIISTLLSMVASRNESVFLRILTFFEEQYKENPAYVPEFDELLSSFGHFISDSFEQLFIVVDALDETEGRECVAYALRRISETCQCAKILVTSRLEIDIARAYEDLPNTSIEPADVAGDIELYVKAEVAAKIKGKKLKLRDPGLEEVICDTLIQGAHGMFQWVKCQIDQLCKLRNDRALRNALNDLPKTLHDTYLRILRKLEEESADEVETVQRLLRWLVRAVRNLTLSELAECVSIDPQNAEDSFDFDAVFTDPEDVVELCGSLITVSPEGVVALAHYTVKEFLVSEHVKGLMPQFWVGCGEVHAELARVCLTYLCYDDFSGTEEQSGEVLLQTFSDYKFLRYAVQAWGSHAHLADTSDEVFDLTMKLFETDPDETGNYHTWSRIHYYLQKASGQRSKISFRPLFFASSFGLSRAVSALLENDPEASRAEPMKAAAAAGHDVVMKIFLDQPAPTESKTLEQCLYGAASNSQETVVKLLLDHGVNVDARGGKHGTALQVAALEGRHQVVSVLLGHGANLNVTCQRYGTPLAAAAEKSHMQTFQTLVDHAANVNGRGGWYAYPLVSAIVGKNMQMVDILIKKGADLNALGGRHGCALMAAASLGMLDLIRSLVSHGARVNDEDDKGSDSLYAGCMAGNLNSVKLLLELGADVNAKGGKHRNALNAASTTGNIEIVKCLLEEGADVDFFDEHYGNSLQVAASAGHEGIVRLLAEAGVDVNAPSGDRGTALVAAAQNGHEETVRILFDLGVPSGDTYEMSNAIMVAARKGHIGVVKVLVEMGASLDDVSIMATYPSCNGLEAGAAKSNLEMVQLLLDLGADVNYTNEAEYGTALIAAILSERDNGEVVKLLLDSGADINATAETAVNAGGCALGAAIFRDDYDLCTVLINRGADVNLVNGAYYSCLQLAVHYDNERLVDLLLDHGADVNLTVECSNEEGDDGVITPLQAAALYSSSDMVLKLINQGAELSIDVEDCRFVSALQVASYRDDPAIVQTLIDAGSDVNQIGGLYGTSLQAAAFRGSLEAAKVLLDAGADINTTHVGDNGSALMAAIVEGQLDMVQLLIDRGADVNLADGSQYEYPLQAAAWYENEEITRVLIEVGADVNSKGGMYGTALQGASIAGNVDISSLLLENGADSNIIGGRYGTALQAAYTEGYYNVISLLFEYNASHSLQGGQYGTALGAAVTGSCQTLVSGLLRGHRADPNLPVRKYGSALQACIQFRPDDVFYILLACGADVNAHGGLHGTPLISASIDGNEEWVTALLDAGANVDTEGNAYYPTAAHAAIGAGKLPILKLLVERGADIHMKNGARGSTMEHAACFGDLSTIRYLLKHGVDLKATGRGKYHNVMQAAALRNSWPAIKCLIKHGADIHTKGGKYGSTLTACVLGGDLEAVEFLLKSGIDVNAKGGVYGRPLQAAAAKGSVPAVLLLLRYGAAVNAKGGKYRTALQAACVSGDYDLVELLLERGAEVNITGGNCGSALHAAALFGYDDICELLMKNGAEWSLVNHDLLHFTPYRLDGADEILREVLERQQNGWPEEDDSDSESDEEEDDEEEEEFLKLNVESIPLFDAPYDPLTLARADEGEGWETDDESPDDLNSSRSSPPTEDDAKDWMALEWLQVECGSNGDLGRE